MQTCDMITIKCFHQDSYNRAYVALSVLLPWYHIRICAVRGCPSNKGFYNGGNVQEVTFYDVASFEMKHLGFWWIKTQTWIRAKGLNSTEAFINDVPEGENEVIAYSWIGPEDWTLPSVLRNVSFHCWLLWHIMITLWITNLIFLLLFSYVLTELLLYNVSKICKGLKCLTNKSKKLPFAFARKTKKHKHMPHSMTPLPTPLFPALLAIFFP